MTKLVEFKNQNGETLRGLLDKANSQKGVVFLHGFEGTTVKTKFKNIVDKLKGKANLFRFDFSGCGLSDGKFEDMTVEKSKKELEKAVKVLKRECPKVKKISLVAHSFGSCVALKYISEKPRDIDKVVFMAPAFNQKELLRYWFTEFQAKNKKIIWENFRKYLSERKFQNLIRKKKRMVKEHFVSSKYFLENEKIDYQNLFDNLNFDFRKILIVHGIEDDRVKPKSNNKLPSEIRTIRVMRGDHHLGRPDMVKQYLEKVVKFLNK